MLARGSIETTDNVTNGMIRSDGPWGFNLRGRTSHAGRNDRFRNRAIFQASTLANIWVNDLTSAQKNDWTAYATATPVEKDSGRTIVLNGYQMFARMNRTRMNIDGTIGNDAPPIGPDFETNLEAVIPTPLNTLILAFQPNDPWSIEPDTFCVVYDAGRVSSSWTISKRQNRLAAVIPSNPPLGYPLPIEVPRPYNDTAGSPAIVKTRALKLW